MIKDFKSPVYNVIAVPLEKIEANDYNPNHVAKREMDLLYQSIKCDGYTMPVVCFYDKERDKYVIVDGFHRYTIILTRKDIFERENGMLPVSVIEKDIRDRMASMQLITSTNQIRFNNQKYWTRRNARFGDFVFKKK